ncbi:hypothetical protein AB1Y20_005883 [Prymnesium parvum]|uniref:Uncharacterized protein n=1 Tax=Prymnesium parvum TaxID=97485 RepID=A0AB34J124_PRYPA
MITVFLLAPLALEPLVLRRYEPPREGERSPTRLIDDNSLKRLSPTHQRKLLSAVSQFGNVAKTTVAASTAQTGSGSGWSNTALSLPVGTSIYGPFEAGFSSTQDSVIREQFGCSTPSSCYSAGGWDTRLAQGACAGQCGITLPRWSSGRLYSFADTCGGHTNYHFHQSMNCTYSATSGSTHSTQIGEGEDSAKTKLYGKWEDFSTSTLPSLDACGGHFGVTPDSNGASVYHNHVQDHPPFTYGCYGPNDAGGLVTIAQCRAINSQLCGTDSSSVESVTTDEGVISYDAYCPCFDGSGSGYGGGGKNTFADLVELPAISGASSSSSTTTTTSPPPPSPPPSSLSSPSPPPTTTTSGNSDDAPLIIGAICGGVGGLLVLVGVAFLCMSKGSSTVSSTTSTKS